MPKQVNVLGRITGWSPYFQVSTDSADDTWRPTCTLPIPTCAMPRVQRAGHSHGHR